MWQRVLRHAVVCDSHATGEGHSPTVCRVEAEGIMNSDRNVSSDKTPGVSTDPVDVPAALKRTDGVEPAGSPDAPQGGRPTAKTTLGGVIIIWIIFAPTAAFAAIALGLWLGLNDGPVNSAYPVFLALFFTLLFFVLVLGVVRNYFRERRGERRQK